VRKWLSNVTMFLYLCYPSILKILNVLNEGNGESRKIKCENYLEKCVKEIHFIY
jgi:hypothetical protein